MKNGLNHHLEHALIVVNQRFKPDGSYPDFDIRQMRDSLRYARMAETIDVIYNSDHTPNCDDAVIDYCHCKKPQVVLLCLQGAGRKEVAPTPDAIGKVTRLGIPTVVFWFDIHSDDYAELLDRYCDSVTLNLIGGADASSHKPLRATNYVYSSLAYDENYFNMPEGVRDIDIGFLGSVKGDRVDWLEGLKENGINTFIGGGQLTANWMPFEEYCKLTARFKIALSFSAIDGQSKHQLRTWLKSLLKHPGNVLNKSQLLSALRPVAPPTRYMIRSRIWEALWLRTFVLEEDNPITSQYFEPLVDYVPYTTLEDLVDKVKYYLKNTKERDAIRLHGRATVEKYYNAKLYFENIFEAAGIPSNNQFQHHPGEIWNKAHFDNWLLPSLDNIGVAR